MDIIYYLATFLFAILLIFGPILLIAFLIRPTLFTKFTKKSYKRRKIFVSTFLTGIAVLTILVTLGVIFEPESVKADRIAKQKAEAAQNAALEKQKQEELKPIKKTEEVSSKVEFKTIENEDNALAKGEEKTSVEGVEGEKKQIYEVTYVKGLEIDRKLIKEEVTIPPVDKVVLIGTYVAPDPTPVQSFYSAPAHNTPQTNNSLYYANCTEARNAGAAPIYAGQAGYRSALDRDSDGIACE